MERPPLWEYELLHATDPDHVRDVMGRLLAPHNLSVVGPDARLDARLHCCRLVDVAVNFVRYGNEVMTDGATGEFFAVLVPLSGVSVIDYAGRRHLATPTVGLVISPSDDSVVFQSRRDASQLVCRIERPAMEALLAGLLGESLKEPLRFEPSLAVDGPAGAASRLHWLVHDIDHHTHAIDHPALVRDFEQGLMARLLLTQPHNYSSALASTARPASSREVRHAIALMQSHPERPLSITDIATTLNISGRSLQRRFRRDLETTFKKVLHEIRLRRVHDDLRSSGPEDASVNDVLTRWCLPMEGYTYQAYRRHFGETPSDTLHRLT